MPRVFVVLAAYEGEAYLPVLLESIGRQSYADWTLLARDDGSQDATQTLLEQAACRDRRIVVLPDDGVRRGAFGNFGFLMEEAYRRGAECLFLADQDDRWYGDKIARQVERLQMVESAAGPQTPQLVYSDVAVVDEQLAPIHPSYLRQCRLPYASDQPLAVLVGRGFVLGCAAAINRALLELALPLPAAVASHDWWIALCAASAGQLTRLDESTLDYRRHGKNTSQAYFWTALNPLRNSWSKRWQTGWRSYCRSIEQAILLRDRIHERAMERADTFDMLDAFCGVFERSSSRVRRILQLHRLGMPMLDLPRQLLYYLCTGLWSRPGAAD